MADFVDVSSKPTVHLIAEEEIPELWQGEKGGRARLLAGSGGPDMTEMWMWEMQPGEKFASPGHTDDGDFYLYESKEYGYYTAMSDYNYFTGDFYLVTE